MKGKILIAAFAMIFAQACFALGWPSPKREVRAVWLTTIGGLDWPHNKAYNGQGIEAQQQELCNVLDLLKAANFNTVILQTRVRSTVIYPSAIEPWDDCLTGHANRNPGYDPLQFAVEECHKRGMELHAWVVAFPGNSFKSARNLGSRALQRRKPRLCLKTDEFWMLNPGEPETADYLADICSEITRNYDVDGINLDYIRYPESSIHYNDAATYRKYGKGQDKADWRRQNVTHCVETIYKAVKSIKPWVRISCSPVGKSQDLTEHTSHGWNSFATVYQDAQGWLRQGIMDMLVPMMYFRSGQNFYPFMFDWEEDSYGRIFCGGLGAYKLRSNDENWDFNEMKSQLNALRQSGAGGQAFFRSQNVTENTKGIYDYLKNNFYQLPALTPALTWESKNAPLAPQECRIEETKDGFRLCWASSNEKDATYNIYVSEKFPVDTERPEHLLAVRQKNTDYFYRLPLSAAFLPYFAITTVDKFGNESAPKAFNQPLEGAESFCTGTLSSSENFGKVFLPDDNAEFVMICDIQGQIVRTAPYSSALDISKLRSGLYSVRTLEKKGRSICLGNVFIK